MRAVITHHDGIYGTSGIENINDDDTLRYDNIYSVSGIRLNKIQKGINIVNGKKVVIK